MSKEKKTEISENVEAVSLDVEQIDAVEEQESEQVFSGEELEALYRESANGNKDLLLEGRESTEEERPGSRKAFLNEKMEKERARFEAVERKTAFNMVWGSLQSAKRSRQIVRGVVSGVQPSLDPKVEMVFLTVMYQKQIKVLIPFSEIARTYILDSAYDKDGKAVADDKRKKAVEKRQNQGKDSIIFRQNQLASKYIGVEIPFVITHMSMDHKTKELRNYLVIGSRKQAIEQQERNNYVSKGKTPARIQVDKTYDADIISVGINAVWVNLGGVDARIALKDLTFKWTPSVKELFEVGDVLRVHVKNIITESDGTHNLELSAKDVELEDAKEREHILALDTITTATITSTSISREDDSVTILGWLDMYDMPCIAKFIRGDMIMLRAGQRIRVKVKSFGQNGMVMCSCKGVVSQPIFRTRATRIH